MSLYQYKPFLARRSRDVYTAYVYTTFLKLNINLSPFRSVIVFISGAKNLSHIIRKENNFCKIVKLAKFKFFTSGDHYAILFFYFFRFFRTVCTMQTWADIQYLNYLAWWCAWMGQNASWSRIEAGFPEVSWDLDRICKVRLSREIVLFSQQNSNLYAPHNSVSK
jgi:hypothetical protein